MDHQDWKPIVIKKTISNNKLSNLSNKPKVKTDEDIEEQGKLKVNIADKMSMAKLRTASGYKTQKALADATRGKISAARINELESGKGNVPNGNEKQILFKLIKMKFK